MSDAAKPKPFTLRGVHVLIAMVLFFGMVIAVNVGFAVLAVESFPGEDVRHSYLQGVQFNETIAERREQAELGWRARAELKEAADGAQIEVQLSQRDGTAVRNGDLSGTLRWPADARRDVSLRFEPVSEGLYVARVRGLSPGRWRLRARAQDGVGGALDFEAELTWHKAP